MSNVVNVVFGVERDWQKTKSITLDHLAKSLPQLSTQAREDVAQEIVAMLREMMEKEFKWQFAISANEAELRATVQTVVDDVQKYFVYTALGYINRVIARIGASL